VFVRDLEPFIVSTFSELGAEWGTEPAPFVLYHGPVNAEEDGPVEVCVPKPGGEQQLPSAEVAFTQISGSQCNFPEILGAYESVYRWAKEHGREPDGPPREIYFCVPEDAEELRMEIALPLR
jgi:effector-binding domain-containing protein